MLLFLNGCLSMNAPDGFLITKESGSEIKAVSSDDAYIWVRTFSDDYDGDLAFWVDALLNDFVENRGYLLEEKNPIRTSGDKGVDGEEMFFQCTAQGALQPYFVCLFTKKGLFSNKICVVEFVGRGETFNKHIEAVRETVRTLEF